MPAPRFIAGDRLFAADLNAMSDLIDEAIALGGGGGGGGGASPASVAAGDAATFAAAQELVNAEAVTRALGDAALTTTTTNVQNLISRNLIGTTTSAEPARLTIGGVAANAANTQAPTANKSRVNRMQIIARQSAGSSGTVGDTVVWEAVVAFKRGATAADTALVGQPSIDVIARDEGATGWDISLTADTTLGSLNISVTGAASKTIAWFARVYATETV